MIFDHDGESTKELLVLRRLVSTTESSSHSLTECVVKAVMFAVIEEGDFGFKSAEVDICIHRLEDLRDVQYILFFFFKLFFQLI